MSEALTKDQCAAVPLVELLRRVPLTARFFADMYPMTGTEIHPVGRFCHEAADSIASLTARCRQLEQERAMLRGFAQDVLADWCNVSFDGGDLQDMAVRHSLLEPVVVEEACDPETCSCAEVGEFPMECYRKTDLLLGSPQGAKP